MLTQMGWTASREAELQQGENGGLVPARVVEEHRGEYEVITPEGPCRAGVSGRLRHEAGDRCELPAVGDWVMVRLHPEGGRGTIGRILPRTSALVRKAAGLTTEAQVVAANLDRVFFLAGLDLDFNLRRIERGLALIWESGAQPVLILSKADLCDDVDGLQEEAEAVAPGVPVHAVSATTGQGVDALSPYLVPGQTVALIGSSGVGKSTLINRLAGTELQRTGAVRASDGRGRHVTTSRQLLRLPDGALLIDTPGMREISLWGAEQALEGVFEEITELAGGCRFSDCRHRTEPGCAVRRALEDGTLDPDRLASYRKLEREQAHLERRQSHRALLEERQKWKRITVAYHKEVRERRRAEE